MITSSFKNGEPCSIDVFEDRGFMYSDGVFETMRCTNGYIPLWAFHRKRLERSASILQLKLNFYDVEAQLAQVMLTAANDAVVKLIVCRYAKSRASYIEENIGVTLYFVVRDASSRQHRSDGVLLKSSSQALYCNPILKGLKLINRSDYIASAVSAMGNAACELLFFDDVNNIVETMHHNIFAKIGATIVTPTLSRSGVRGVMRDYIINIIAPSLSLNIIESDFSLAELSMANEVFLSNAIDGVIPVKGINQYPVSLGSITHQIQTELNKVF